MGTVSQGRAPADDARRRSSRPWSRGSYGGFQFLAGVALTAKGRTLHADVRPVRRAVSARMLAD